MADAKDKMYKYRQEISQVSLTTTASIGSLQHAPTYSGECANGQPGNNGRQRDAGATRDIVCQLAQTGCQLPATLTVTRRAAMCLFALTVRLLDQSRSAILSFMRRFSSLDLCLLPSNMPKDSLAALTASDMAACVAYSDLTPSPESFKRILIDTIGQMMYVSGETGEPSVETTSIIEDIVRQQVIELLRNCTELASRRGSKSISTNDLIFQIRHDQAKVSRLRTFLSWKDVRKNIKDSDDKGADADLAAGDDPGNVAGPVDEAAKKNKKAKVGLPWEPASFFNVEVPERDDEEDDEEEESNYITLQRLRKADDRTRAMTREEYVTWSEYRQASFTWRKGKRFREWAGFGIVTDSKPSDDIVDILGFLTFEMVQTLTEMALKAKEQEDTARALNGGDAASLQQQQGSTKKRKHQHGLFDPPSEGRTPVEPRHVQEAFRRFQQRPKKTRAMLNLTRIAEKTPLNIF